ncbi:DNA-binding protein [Streptomyces sp. ms191]|uniref:helix-turn-helix transcriptional regulator n=1 Tax=Streptomyces sp. ms191 TaxID=1827978 RepID=UPI0011CE162D|nr:DNA-binding protein [Streptomyces sp. ms191]TXS28589.1 DNA-binding protein [Streptomyces sp. ms191]
MTKPSQPTLAEIRQWPATVSVPQAASAIGCSKQHLHDRIKRGDAPVKTIPLGARHVVITADLVRLLSGESRPAKETEAA